DSAALSANALPERRDVSDLVSAAVVAGDQPVSPGYVPLSGHPVDHANRRRLLAEPVCRWSSRAGMCGSHLYWHQAVSMGERREDHCEGEALDPGGSRAVSLVGYIPSEDKGEPGQG